MSAFILLKNSVGSFGAEKSTSFQKTLDHESRVKQRFGAKFLGNRLLVVKVFSAKFSRRVFQQNRPKADV
jgi:hypothetical protein